MDLLATAADAATTDVASNGVPVVARFSSLYEFLEKCGSGVSIFSHTLDCGLQKTEDGMWTGYDEWDKEGVDSRAVVRDIRYAIEEDDPEAVLDKVHVLIGAADPLAVKREVIAEGEATSAELIVEEREKW